MTANLSSVDFFVQRELLKGREDRKENNGKHMKMAMGQTQESKNSRIFFCNKNE
jgi:hypothetical protein